MSKYIESVEEIVEDKEDNSEFSESSLGEAKDQDEKDDDESEDEEDDEEEMSEENIDTKYNVDKKHSEEASVDSAKKAASVTKKTTAPGGEKTKGDQVADKIKENSYDFSEDLSALVESEATLSEGFKDKAAVIFEAAIKSKLTEEVSAIEQDIRESYESKLNEAREEMVESLDSYLDYMAEKFFEENEIAIENGIRTEIAEEFMNNLKGLFEDSYITVPDSKVDLVDDLAEQVKDLEDRLNGSIEESVGLKEELNTLKKSAIVREHSSDLAETQADKLKSLVEDIDFVDEDTFSKKVATVKESYFTKKRNKPAEIFEESSFEEETTLGSTMASYVNALKASNKQY